MFESQICQYNQTGFCKFREHCRKRHENIICQENHDYKSHGCTLRHPKKCRSYEREGTCRFKECAYTHQENQGDARNQRHNQDILNIQVEMNQMKNMILQIENKIEILKNMLDAITKTNVEEIVAIVVSSLERAKEIENSEAIKTVEKSPDIINCDKCIFNSQDEWTMIRHMSQEHNECSSCDLCGTYFGTKSLLKMHNKKEHNIETKDDDSSEEEIEISEHDCEKCTFKSKSQNDIQVHMEETHERKMSRNKKKKK